MELNDYIGTLVIMPFELGEAIVLPRNGEGLWPLFALDTTGPEQVKGGFFLDDKGSFVRKDEHGFPTKSFSTEVTFLFPYENTQNQ